MSPGEALAEARRRWGPTACVYADGKGWYEVGVIMEVKGEGTSYPAAFADSNKKALEKKQ